MNSDDDDKFETLTEAHMRLSGGSVIYAALANFVSPKYAQAEPMFLRNGDWLLEEATTHGVPELADTALNRTILLTAEDMIEIIPSYPGTQKPLMKLFGDILTSGEPAVFSQKADPNKPDKVLFMTPLERTYGDSSYSGLCKRYLSRDPETAERIKGSLLKDTLRGGEMGAAAFRALSKAYEPQPAYPYDLAGRGNKGLEENRRIIAGMIMDHPGLNLILPRADDLREADAAFQLHPRATASPYERQYDPADPNAELGLPARSEVILRTIAAYQDLKTEGSFRPKLPVILASDPEDGRIRQEYAAGLFNRVGNTVAARLQDKADPLGARVHAGMSQADREFWQSGAYRLASADIKFDVEPEAEDDPVFTALMTTMRNGGGIPPAPGSV